MKPSRKAACHHERHLTGVALKVYNLLWRLSKKSKTRAIAITNERIAMLIGAHCHGKRAEYISRAKTALRRAGWLHFEGVSKSSATGTWTGGRYIVISHEDWTRHKHNELGHSPCQPVPLQVSVSSVHKGGRAFKRQNKPTTEGHTANGLAAEFVEVQNPEIQNSRAHGEGHTDLQRGRTHTVRMGKDTQSVDFDFPTVDKTTGDATAVPPVAVNDANVPDGTSKDEDAGYAERRAVLKEQAAMLLQSTARTKLKPWPRRMPLFLDMKSRH